MALESRWPAELVRGYRAATRMRGWLLLLLAMLAVAPLAGAALVRSRQPAHRAEISLLLSVALGLIVGSTATAGHDLRYLVPTLPFFVAAAGLAASYLLSRPVAPR